MQQYQKMPSGMYRKIGEPTTIYDYRDKTHLHKKYGAEPLKWGESFDESMVEK